MHRCEYCPSKNLVVRVWPFTCACGAKFENPNATPEKPEAKPVKPRSRLLNRDDLQVPLGCTTSTTAPLADWIQDRVLICASCDQRIGAACGVLKKSGKPGLILHPKGARREAAKCPIGRW